MVERAEEERDEPGSHASGKEAAEVAVSSAEQSGSTSRPQSRSRWLWLLLSFAVVLLLALWLLSKGEWEGMGMFSPIASSSRDAQPVSDRQASPPSVSHSPSGDVLVASSSSTSSSRDVGGSTERKAAHDAYAGPSGSSVEEVSAVATRTKQDNPPQQASWSADVSRLQDQVDALRRKMEELRQEKEDARQRMRGMREQHEQWLQAHRSRQRAVLRQKDLMGLALAWRELAFSPLLSAKQRDEAMRWSRQAETLGEQRRRWLRSMWRAIHALRIAPMENIIPETHWWQRWLRQQIALRRLPGQDVQEAEDLRRRLWANIEVMAQGGWPDDTTWLPVWNGLRSRGLLEDLPESFAGARHAQARLLQAARIWWEDPS